MKNEYTSERRPDTIDRAELWLKNLSREFKKKGGRMTTKEVQATCKKFRTSMYIEPAVKLGFIDCHINKDRIIYTLPPRQTVFTSADARLLRAMGEILTENFYTLLKTYSCINLKI